MADDGRRPTPREHSSRCSVQADLRRDPKLGTAFPASKILLVEQPGRWGRDGLTRSTFDRAVAAELVRVAGRAGIRVLGIRQPGRSRSDTVRQWAVVDCRMGSERMVWHTFTDDRELLNAAWDVPDAAGPPSDADRDRVFLVCTHGSHDACCALRGRPVAAALNAIRANGVWECTHVGGDRFAANVLVLPTGELYGGVRPSDSQLLVDTVARGEVVPTLLRGKVGLAPEVQAALAHAQRVWGGPAASYRVVFERRVTDRSAEVRIEKSDGRHRVADVVVSWHRAEPHLLTCQAVTPADAVVYEPVGMTELVG